MESLIIFLFVSVYIAGSSGFLFVSNQCDHMMSEEFREMMNRFPPNEQELKALCPGGLELMQCYDNEIQNVTGKTFREIANSGDERMGQMAIFFNDLLALIQDLCNEDSQFHQNYVENSQCMQEHLLVAIRKCTLEANGVVDAYRTSSFADENSSERCISKAYELACGMKSLGENCGEAAKNVLLEVARRLQSLKLIGCTEEILVTLRGKFLDFLEQQGKDRDYFATALEF